MSVRKTGTKGRKGAVKGTASTVRTKPGGAKGVKVKTVKRKGAVKGTASTVRTKPGGAKGVKAKAVKRKGAVKGTASTVRTKPSGAKGVKAKTVKRKGAVKGTASTVRTKPSGAKGVKVKTVKRKGAVKGTASTVRTKPSGAKGVKVKTVKRKGAVKGTVKDVSSKMSAISDYKQLSKEIKVIEKILADNQEIMMSMKRTVDSIVTSLEQNQKQSIPNTVESLPHVGDNTDFIQDYSKMIIKITRKIDKLSTQILDMSDMTKTLKNISDGIKTLRNDVEPKMMVGHLKEELQDIVRKADYKILTDKLTEIDMLIRSIPETIKSIDDIKSTVENTQQQFMVIADKISPIPSIATDLDVVKDMIESVSQNSRKADVIKDTVETIATRIDPLKINNEIRAVLQDIGLLKSLADITDATKQIDMSSTKTDENARESTPEIMVMLRLSEFRSRIRMNAESKYGDLKNIEHMAEQTCKIVELLRVSDQTGSRAQIRYDVGQWAVSKIFECADRWDARFSDVLGILFDRIERDDLVEIIRVQQIKDVYGARAVDEVKRELGMI